MVKRTNRREGFYFRVKGIDVFVATSQKVKSKKLAYEIAKLIVPVVNDYAIEWIFARLKPATCEDTEFTFEGKLMQGYDIFGKDFGGAGSADKNDGKTIIIKL